MGLPRFRYSKDKSKIVNDTDAQDRDFYLDTKEHRLYVADVTEKDSKKYLLNDSGFEAVLNSQGKPTGSIVQKIYNDAGSYTVSDTTHTNQVVLGDASIEKVNSGYSSLNFIIGESDVHNECNDNRVTFGIQCREKDQDYYPRLIFDNKELFKANHTLKDSDNNGLAIGDPLKKVLKSYIVDLIYPVGSIYISYPDTTKDLKLDDKYNPNKMWENTKWQLIAMDTYLRAGGFEGESDADKNQFLTGNFVGEIGGINQFKLDINQLPPHAHTLAAQNFSVDVVTPKDDGQAWCIGGYSTKSVDSFFGATLNTELTTRQEIEEIHLNNNPKELHHKDYPTIWVSSKGNQKKIDNNPQYLNVAMWRRIS